MTTMTRELSSIKEFLRTKNFAKHIQYCSAVPEERMDNSIESLLPDILVLKSENSSISGVLIQNQLCML